MDYRSGLNSLFNFHDKSFTIFAMHMSAKTCGVPLIFNSMLACW